MTPTEQVYGRKMTARHIVTGTAIERSGIRPSFRRRAGEERAAQRVEEDLGEIT